jgi:hypothetical protein
MFEKLLEEIDKISKITQIAVPIAVDQDGYSDRECPNQECRFQFKVNEEDWEKLFKDDAVFCPFCRHEEDANNWWTSEQIEKAEQQVRRHVLSRLDKAILKGAKDFNSKQSKNSFIKMSMSIKGVNPYHYILPISSKEEMQLKIQCKICDARYAVIGSAFFCPCCGHNSAEETFDNSMLKIESKIKNLPIIRAAIEKISKDEAETTCRSIVESGINECVVAFQRFSEITFSNRSPITKIPFNAFQKLDVGETFWRNLINKSYSDWLTQNEYKLLVNLFQKRHLLSHTEGIVDQMYLNKTTDKTYKVGQRIVIKESDVILMVSLVRKIINKIREADDKNSPSDLSHLH